MNLLSRRFFRCPETLLSALCVFGLVLSYALPASAVVVDPNVVSGIPEPQQDDGSEPVPTDPIFDDPLPSDPPQTAASLPVAQSPLPVTLRLSSDRTVAAPGETLSLTVTVEVNQPDTTVAGLALALELPPDLVVAPHSPSSAEMHLPPLTNGKPTVLPFLLAVLNGSASGAAPITTTLWGDGVAPISRTIWLGIQWPPPDGAGKSGSRSETTQGPSGATLRSPDGRVNVIVPPASAAPGVAFAYTPLFSSLDDLPAAAETLFAQDAALSSSGAEPHRLYLPAVAADAQPPEAGAAEVSSENSPPPAPLPADGQVLEERIDATAFPTTTLPMLVNGGVNFFEMWELTAQVAVTETASFTATDGLTEALHRFDDGVLLAVDVSQIISAGVDPATLDIWTRDSNEEPWTPLLSIFDPQAQTVRAWTSHFSLFGLGQGLKQTADLLPGVQAFTVDDLYGGAAATIPIETPQGLGGLSPGLSLAYSSLTADDAYRTAGDFSVLMQASAAGYGWHLGGINYIARSDPPKDNNEAEAEKTFALVLDGERVTLSLVNGVWRTNPEIFAKVEWLTDSNNRKSWDGGQSAYDWTGWVVTLPSGTKYEFGDAAGFDAHQPGTGYNVTMLYRTLNSALYRLTNRWYLRKVTDVLGNEMEYAYRLEYGTASCAGNAWYVRAVDPVTIWWSKNTGAGVPYAFMTATFTYDAADRADTFGSGDYNCDQRMYGQNNRMTAVDVNVYSGSGWRTIRSYALTQTATSWSSGGTTLTRNLLSSVAVKGEDGGTLRTYSFTYTSSNPNHVWLATANNGWAGTVSYSYLPYRVSCSFAVCQHGMNRYAVSVRSADGGAGTQGVKTSYYYGPSTDGGEWGAVGEDGGFLGYKKAELTSYSGSPEVVVRFERLYSYTEGAQGSRENPDPRQGKVKQREVYDFQGGTRLSLTEYQWNAYWFRNSAWSWTPETRTWLLVGNDPEFPPTWIRMEAVTQTVGVAVDVTRYDYSTDTAYDVQFGNMTAVRELDGATLQRRTTTEYFPNTAGDTVPGYLVNLPARVLVYNGAGACLAETRNIYGIGQIEIGFQTPPTTPHLVKTEQLLNGGCPESAATIAKYDANWAITRYAYDAWGNRVTVNRLGADAAADLPFATVYDSTYHLFPIEQYYTSGGFSGYRESAEYYGVNGTPVTDSRAFWGAMEEWCGVNGICTRQAYDQFGRVTKRWDNLTDTVGTPADSAASVWWDYFAPGAYSGQTTFMVREWRAPRCHGNLTRKHYNGLGQLLAVHSSSQDWTHDMDSCGVTTGGQEVHTYYAYDGLGRQTKASVPTLHARSDWLEALPATWPGYSVTTYDALDRPTTATAPNGVITQFVYNTTRSSYSYIDAPSGTDDRMLRWTLQDRLGNTTSVRTYARSGGSWVVDGTVNLAYNTTGNLTSVTNVGGVVTTMTYDEGGRKLTMTDPNLGAWSYAYDRQGRLTRQQDAKGNVTCLYYDGLERLTDKQFSTGGATCPATARAYNTAHAIRFVYDTSGAAKGQLKESTRYGEGPTLWYTRTLAYDTLGRPSSEAVELGTGLSATTGYGYDAWSRPSTTTYPDGEVLTLAYDGMGLPARLTSSTQGTLVSGTTAAAGMSNAVTYDEAGRLTKARFGSGDLWRTLSYAPFATAVQGGLLSSIQVGTAGDPDASLKLGYSYDAFGNIATLTEGTTPNSLTYDAQNRLTGAYTRSYSYWPTGRFQQFEGVTYTYGTGASGSPYHAVVSTSAGGAFGYDAAGNMTGRKLNSSAPQQTMGWTPANELRWVAVGGVLNESYRYDPNGERILRSVEGGAVQYVYFPHYETSVQGGVTTATRSYFFGGVRIAQKVGTSALTYLHSDHLGSTVLTTQAAGSNSQQYHAYGAVRSGGVPTDWRYTGQEQDGTGLVYLHARYYDPASGQFLSPDTLVPDPNNLYAYNRYMYGYGNPAKYSDPSGHDPLDDAWREEFNRVHGRYPDAHDEALRLFSIAYPGEWSEALFYSESGQLRDLEGIILYLHDTNRRNWDGLGQALESMSGWYNDNEASLFAQDLSFIFAGTRGRSQTGDGPYWQSGHHGENLDVFIGRGGLPERYFDRPGDQDNDADFNVHHFVWAFGMGYEVGSTTGRFINMTKEYRDAPLNVDQSDLELGGLGARLGGALHSDSSMLRSLSSRLYEALGYEP